MRLRKSMQSRNIPKTIDQELRFWICLLLIITLTLINMQLLIGMMTM